MEKYERPSKKHFDWREEEAKKYMQIMRRDGRKKRMASEDADAAVIEFMRDYSMADKELMSTPEFDILSIIVYRE